MVVCSVSEAMVTFCQVNSNGGRQLISKTQLPIKLAYAATYHRVQGLTLSGCVVDCRNMLRTLLEHCVDMIIH